MEPVKQFELLSAGIRLKILSDNLFRDISRIYKSNNIEIEPGFFPVLYLLKDGEKRNVNELVNNSGLSHSVINQLTDKLQSGDFIKTSKDKKDKRINFIYLSAKGKKILSQLELIWEDILKAYQDLYNESGIDIISLINKIEIEIKKKSIYDRIADKTKIREINKVDIIDYSLPLKSYFKDLNYEWLKKYFRVENKDEKVLSNPEKYILENGGFILFARVDGYICGTVAMIRHKNNIFELAKMSVSEKYQGRQIGNKLATEAIDKAKKLGAEKIFLETNDQLSEAIRLYRKLGFENVEYPNGKKSDYSRPTFKMELNLINQ